MPRVELSNDGHAVLRGPETVRNRERRAAARATDSVDGAASKDMTYTDALVAQLLESWSLPLPLPRNDDGSFNFSVFDELEIVDYDKLRDVALAIYAEARGIVVEPDIDPASPTTPLGD